MRFDEVFQLLRPNCSESAFALYCYYLMEGRAWSVKFPVFDRVTAYEFGREESISMPSSVVNWVELTRENVAEKLVELGAEVARRLKK